jgi:hypothetical protein
MDHNAMHLIPQLLVRDRVLAQDDRTQAPRDEGCHHVGQRAGDAYRAFVGLDTEEMLRQAEMAGVDLDTALEVIAGTVFRIDVDRPHQPFFPERPVGGQDPGQQQEADGSDLHRPRASVVRSQSLGRAQLRLADHALVTVLHILHPVLQVAAFVRQQALDGVRPARHMSFEPVGYQIHGLTDLEAMTRHDDPSPAVSGRTGPSGRLTRPMWAFAAENASGNRKSRAPAHTRLMLCNHRGHSAETSGGGLAPSSRMAPDPSRI